MQTMQITLGDLTFAADDSTGYEDFWADLSAGRWEPETILALRTLLREGSRFVDIGAWIGPLALTAAAIGAEVDAFEPDPRALEALERNIALNPQLADRIFVHPYAVGAADTEADLVAPGLGESVSSLDRRHGDRVRVRVRSLDSVARDGIFRGADAVKVDIEGGEYAILRGLRRHTRDALPVMLLSTHVAHLRDRLPTQWPLPLRRVVLHLLGLRQLRVLLWLRHYHYWYVRDAQRWRSTNRVRVIARLLHFSDKEFVLSPRPLGIVR